MSGIVAAQVECQRPASTPTGAGERVDWVLSSAGTSAGSVATGSVSVACDGSAFRSIFQMAVTRERPRAVMGSPGSDASTSHHYRIATLVRAACGGLREAMMIRRLDGWW